MVSLLYDVMEGELVKFTRCLLTRKYFYSAGDTSEEDLTVKLLLGEVVIMIWLHVKPSFIVVDKVTAVSSMPAQHLLLRLVCVAKDVP